MTIRIINAPDWRCLPPGEVLNFDGDHDRVVKVELNTEAPTRVDLMWHDADGVEHRTFLAVVDGLEKIEVLADAAAYLDFSGGNEVWYFTNDGGVTTSPMSDEASFTKLLGRKTRSDQIEMMMRLQQANYERLLAAQSVELSELEAQLEAQRENSPSTDGGASIEEQPEPPATPAGEGEGEGTSAPAATPPVSA